MLNVKFILLGIAFLICPISAQVVNWGTSDIPENADFEEAFRPKAIDADGRGLVNYGYLDEEHQDVVIWELGYFDAGKDFSNVNDYDSLATGWNRIAQVTSTRLNYMYQPGTQVPVEAMGKDMYIFAIYGTYNTEWITSPPNEDGASTVYPQTTFVRNGIFIATQGIFPSSGEKTFDTIDTGNEDPFRILYGNVNRGTEILSGEYNTSQSFTNSLTNSPGPWEVQFARFPAPVPEVSSFLLAIFSGMALSFHRRRR